MNVSDIQICRSLAPRQSNALFNSPVHSWLSAQPAGNCRCVQWVCEDIIWQISTELLQVKQCCQSQWLVIDKQFSGMTPICGKKKPPKLCNINVLDFMISLHLHFSCFSQPWSNDMTIYLHDSTAQWTLEWRMILHEVMWYYSSAEKKETYKLKQEMSKKLNVITTHAQFQTATPF